MNEQVRIGYPKARLVCADMEGFDALAELALDMRSSWNHAVDAVKVVRAYGPAGVYAVAAEAAPA